MNYVICYDIRTLNFLREGHILRYIFCLGDSYSAVYMYVLRYYILHETPSASEAHFETYRVNTKTLLDFK